MSAVSSCSEGPEELVWSPDSATDSAEGLTDGKTPDGPLEPGVEGAPDDFRCANGPEPRGHESGSGRNDGEGPAADNGDLVETE